MNSACIIGIAGYSGTGKTTLIEKLLPKLKKQGFSVGVLKHIHHTIALDVKGKDTDRFHRAGADYVYAHDAHQSLVRSPYRYRDLYETLFDFPSGLDLILVEGHKECALPGIWLEKGAGRQQASQDRSAGRVAIFRDDPGYVRKAIDFIHAEIGRFHAGRMVRAGLLIGGKSRRMGGPKALLKVGGETLAERSYAVLSDVACKTMLLGSGQMPGCMSPRDRLCDVPGLEGPMAGMLSAFRWDPASAWIIAAVDMPLMRKEAWEWLLSQRRPGVWAVLPRIRGSRGVEATGAVYEPMIFGHVESLAGKGINRLQEIALHPRVLTPFIPKSLTAAWRNVNTPAELKRVPGISAHD